MLIVTKCPGFLIGHQIPVAQGQQRIDEAGFIDIWTGDYGFQLVQLQRGGARSSGSFNQLLSNCRVAVCLIHLSLDVCQTVGLYADNIYQRLATTVKTVDRCSRCQFFADTRLSVC